MTRITASLFVASLLATVLHYAPAHALNTRSFISANGLDTNPCNRPAPCRTLQKAHDETNAGGEINMLDPAGYGTVVITKAISIVNDGVGSAGILVPTGGIGIIINAATNDKINLRGLIIEGAGVGNMGIQFLSGSTLVIEDCVVRNFTSNAIRFVPNASSSLAVSNTLVAENINGISVQPTGSGIVSTVFNRVEAYNNSANGIILQGNLSTGQIWGIAMDSVVAKQRVSADGTFGFVAQGGSGISLTRLNVFRSMVSGYHIGVRAMDSGVAAVSQSSLESSQFPWSEGTGGLVFSYGDNYTDGNGALHTTSRQ